MEKKNFYSDSIELNKVIEPDFNTNLVRETEKLQEKPKDGYLAEKNQLYKLYDKFDLLKKELKNLENELKELNTVDFKKVFNIYTKKEVKKLEIKEKEKKIKEIEMQILLKEEKNKINFTKMIEGN